MKYDIYKAFKNLHIKPTATVFIHADAIVAAQLEFKKNNLKFLQNYIIKFLKKSGTIVVPAFNQKSFAEKKFFNVNKTKCDIGKFYEEFRKNKLITRTSHPFYSCSLYGKKKKKYLNANLNDCFGKNTIFDFLLKDNATLITLGCKWQSTFAHYIEQKIGVDYRFFKVFSGKVIINGKSRNITTRYYVRDLSINPQYDFSRVENYLKKIKKINYTTFGRFEVSAAKIQDVFEAIIKLIKKDKKILLEK